MRFERMIGVQYVKKTERLSHYIACCLPHQFDAFVYFDTSKALTELQ